MHTRTYAIVTLLSLCTAAAAQKANAAELSKKLTVDSTYLHNATHQERVVFSSVVKIPGAPWMRLFFDKTNLPQGSWLRLTSIKDNVWQRLDSRSIIDYGYASCYLNGESVKVELIAGPRTRANRVLVVSATYGAGVAETICGPTDDRRQSYDKRGCRFNGGCSGWLFANNAVGSAGHCGSHTNTMILEFNVPRSTSSGSKVRSHPNDQYPTIRNTGGRGTGLGNDWLVTRCGPNSNTRKLPGVAQGGYYCLGAVPATTSGQNIRITGYGTSAVRVLNQVQKTHVGPLYRLSTSWLQYRADTTGGNSGSPVIHENTGKVIGVHTHGGCRSTGTASGNYGTRIDRPLFQAAIKGLIGRTGSAVAYGTRCRGTHSMVATPNIGNRVGLRTTGLPANARGILVVGARATNIRFGRCYILASLDILVPLRAGSTGIAQLNVSIPMDTCLVGTTAYSQHAADDRGQTVTSNGLRITVGYR